jgi:serine/threonine-protein kinase
MPLTPGQILNTRYRIVSLLGQGGFGAVYRAWDLNLHVPCAVKENLDTSDIAQRQFEHEATILATLHHPSLPRVTDHFFIQGQGQYLVMDFIQGNNLEEILSQNGAPFTPEQAINWIGQICDALNYLHTQQPPIIHRDIKPANIKVTPDGRAVLVDFGIAKVYDPHLKTTAGARAVTPGYSPPEQYGFGKTDPRSDVYALGATLYKALTLQDPPESVERAIGTQLTNPSQLNPVIPPWLEKVILHAMQPVPTGRFQSAVELKNALHTQDLLVSTPTVPPTSPPGFGPQPPESVAIPPIKKNFSPWLWFGLAGLLVVAVVVVVWAIGLVTSANTQHAEQTAFALARANTRTAQAIEESTTEAAASEGSPEPDLQTTTAHPPPEITQPLPPDLVSPTFTPILPSHTPTTITPTFTPAPTYTATPAALQPFITDAYGVPMALVPAGSFLMGGDPDVGYQACLELYTNNTSDCARRMFEDADTVHTVTLNSYYIDLYEVTNQRYAECVAAGACSPPERTISKTHSDYYGSPSYGNFPVLYTTWSQAQSYCAWRGGRLPTEAEWERAARGDDGRIYPWGNSFNGSLLNFCDANCPSLDDTIDWFNPLYNDGYADTSPVGAYSNNNHPFNLYDLGGNVWEWVSDWYARDYYDVSPADNPTGPSTGDYRVVRGGSIANTGYVTITYYRDTSEPAGSFWNVGFRCVVNP